MKTRRLGLADVAVASGDLLGETPFWHGVEGALYWVDMRSHVIHRWVEATDEHRRWHMPEICTGVVPASGGGLVVALRHRIAHFDPETAALSPIATIEPEGMGNRLNEMRCDRAGRLWIGSMTDYGAAITGSLYVVDQGLHPKRVLENIRVPNSLAWSPDDRVLYFADTTEGHIRRYSFDLATGTLGTPLLPIGGRIAGVPDGSAMDKEGYLWNARYGGGLVVRMSPVGEVVETVELPVSQPAACAFGGEDLRTLYITTARQRLDAKALGQQPLAGHVFRLRVEVSGILEPQFALP
jgi:sugar lactone lactonase YvrE